MSLSFDELIPNASVRVTKIDKLTYMSVRDLIKVICETSIDYAGQIWRFIPDSNKDEVRENLSNFKFPGKGQQIQPVITLGGALKLLMWLPGDQAKVYRVKATEIITRYAGGDPTLVQEIQANAQSNDPINQMAREVLVQPQAVAVEDEHSKKRRRELEDIEKQERLLAIEERKANIMKLTVDTQVQVRKNQEDIMNTYTTLCPNQTIDERAKSMFRDTFLNLATQGTPQKTIMNGEDSGQLLSISELADRLGIRLKPGDISSLGGDVKAWHYNTYHEDPGTAAKFVNGHNTHVCVYQQRDWDAIEKKLRESADKSAAKDKKTKSQPVIIKYFPSTTST